jgi:hypothetical protein
VLSRATKEKDLRAINLTSALAMIVTLASCASATLGDKSSEIVLKKLEPISGKVSLYVCRSNSLSGGGVAAEAIVNNQSIGSLKSNTFAHVALPAGKIDIYLKRSGIGHNSGNSGTHTIEASPGEVAIIWAGAAGVFGPVTVDDFPNRAEAESCVRGAEYAVPDK